MGKQRLSAAERERRSAQARINFGHGPGAGFGVDIGQTEKRIREGGRAYPIQVPPPGFGGQNRTSPPSGFFFETLSDFIFGQTPIQIMGREALGAVKLK